MGEEFGFLYDSDVYDDDLPYLRKIGGQDYMIVPYAFDTNDMGFMAGGKFTIADDFSRCCIDAFDLLHAEGQTHPKMMSIGLHPRLIGRPSRIAAVYGLFKAPFLKNQPFLRASKIKWRAKNTLQLRR